MEEERKIVLEHKDERFEGWEENERERESGSYLIAFIFFVLIAFGTAGLLFLAYSLL